jgi:chemosensory pili system protein ChpE
LFCLKTGFSKGNRLHFEIIVPAILMGIAFAAPPGAVTAETFRRGARGGFALALGVQLGSLVGDVTYALLALAGLAALAQNSTLQFALGAFGALFLMYLAWSSFTSPLTPAPLPSPDELLRRGERGLGERGEVAAFLSGMAISLANPWAIAFWLSLGGVLASLGVVGASTPQIAVFFASFMFGVILWSLALAVIVGHLRGLMRPAIFRVVSIVCGVALGGFGVLAASRVVFS